MDPIQCDPPNPYVMPLVPAYPKLFALYEAHRDVFWVPSAIQLAADRTDLHKLTPNERRHLVRLLLFFREGDGYVNANLGSNFSLEIKLKEAQCFYNFQKMIEDVHAIVYSQLWDVYAETDEQRSHSFMSGDLAPCLVTKASMVLDWTNPELHPLAERLVFFGALEGIGFSSSFAGIQHHSSKNGLFPGLLQANAWISRDEGLHQQFAAELYLTMQTRLPTETIHRILREVVDVEILFVDDSLRGPEGETLVAGLSPDEMATYVRVCANKYCQMLHVEDLYPGITNPFDFMNNMAGDVKYNQFEVPNVNYVQGASNAVLDDEDFNEPV